MNRFMYLVVAAASVVLASGAAVAQGGVRPDDRATHGPGAAVLPAVSTTSTRPDDRATHGPGSLGVSGDAVRPDDRAWRGVGPAPVVVPVQVEPVAAGDGFDWVDAGIGALMAFGVGLLLLAGSMLVMRHQRVALP